MNWNEARQHSFGEVHLRLHVSWSFYIAGIEGQGEQAVAQGAAALGSNVAKWTSPSLFFRRRRQRSRRRQQMHKGISPKRPSKPRRPFGDCAEEGHVFGPSVFVGFVGLILPIDGGLYVQEGTVSLSAATTPGLSKAQQTTSCITFQQQTSAVV